MTWDEMENAKKGNLFIKLEDGGEITGVFRGEPYCFYQKFGDPTELPDYRPGYNFKFRIAMVVKDGDEYVAKIFQGGSRVRDMLLDNKEENGLDCAYKIKRTGSGKDNTRYTFFAKSQLLDADIEAINLVELPALRRDVAEDEDDDIQF
jgi:hypothetical protein